MDRESTLGPMAIATKVCLKKAHAQATVSLSTKQALLIRVTSRTTKNMGKVISGTLKRAKHSKASIVWASVAAGL
jgi:hypothetical protein